VVITVIEVGSCFPRLDNHTIVTYRCENPVAIGGMILAGGDRG
jgi:hypothetical protein